MHRNERERADEGRSRDTGGGMDHNEVRRFWDGNADFTRTIGQWLNLVIETGFRVERVEEPRPDDDTVRQHPNLQDAQVVAYFLHVRARKPGDARFHSPDPPRS